MVTGTAIPPDQRATSPASHRISPLSLPSSPTSTISSLPLPQEKLTSVYVDEIERYGIPELPQVSPDLVLLVKTLCTIQRRIGQAGRLHLFLELGHDQQQSGRKCFYGHADIVTLFYPTVEIGVGNADIYAMYLASALAGFILKSRVKAQHPTSTVPSTSQLQPLRTSIPETNRTPMNSTHNIAITSQTNEQPMQRSPSLSPISSIVVPHWFPSSSFHFTTHKPPGHMTIDINIFQKWQR